MKNTTYLPTGTITTQDYWEEAWRDKDIPDAINPNDDSPENHYYKVMHTLFARALGPSCAPGARLIELGCGGSRWLPYFHRAFGYDVCGIDYTTTGLHLSRSILDNAGVKGEVVQGDLFEPPSNWVEQFDVVVTFGLVEHFTNTSHVVSACARYLRPGGKMITLVPTMRGLYGVAYRLLRPDVYSKHIPLSRETLSQAHEDAGLSVSRCDYVLGLPGILSAPANTGIASRTAFAVSRLYWKLERSGMGIRPNRFTSPYALCFATKVL